jgi:hypothetical protein
MGELRVHGALRSEVDGRLVAPGSGRVVRGWMITCLALALTGCGQVVPSPVPSSTTAAAVPTGAPPPSTVETASPPATPSAVALPTARVSWTVEDGVGSTVWTSALDGSDPVQLGRDLSATGIVFRTPTLTSVGAYAIGAAADGSSTGLYLLSETEETLLVPNVQEYVAGDDGRYVAVVAEPGTKPGRVVTRTSSAGDVVALGAMPPWRTDRDQLADRLGLAYSPDGRSVAVGRPDGPLRVWGGSPGDVLDRGAPLVLTDEGRVFDAHDVLKKTGTDPERVSGELIADPGTTTVAFVAGDGAPGDNGEVIVLDVAAGTDRRFPLEDARLGVVDVAQDHVLLEVPGTGAVRDLAYLDLRTGKLVRYSAPTP